MSTSPSRAWTISRPAAIARKVDSLKKLLDARTELSNLLSYMDGKTGAEELIARVLQGSGVAAIAGVAIRSRPTSGEERLARRYDPISRPHYPFIYRRKSKEKDNGSE